MPLTYTRSPHAEYDLPNAQTIRETIGSRIRAARMKLGMSQLEVAANLGKATGTYLGLIEKGARNLPAADLVRIAAHFKLPLSHFYP